MGAPLPLPKHHFQLHPKKVLPHHGFTERTRLEFVPHVSSKYHLVVPSSLDAAAWRFFQATMKEEIPTNDTESMEEIRPTTVFFKETLPKMYILQTNFHQQ